MKTVCVEIQRRIFLISAVEINLIYALYPRIVPVELRKAGICMKLAVNC
jgi:hypothetical protein